MRKKLPLISGILNVLEKLKGNTGIIENTDVAVHTIAAGKYVIWKNDLYKASSAISIGDTLSLSNLTAVSDGIGNELNSNIMQYTDVTGTTDSSTGFLNLGLTTDKRIVSCFSTSINGYVVIPLHYNGYWHCVVCSSGSTIAPYRNETFKIRVYYY